MFKFDHGHEVILVTTESQNDNEKCSIIMITNT
jgi:hypothetical protein